MFLTDLLIIPSQKIPLTCANNCRIYVKMFINQCDIGVDNPLNRSIYLNKKKKRCWWGEKKRVLMGINLIANKFKMRFTQNSEERNCQKSGQYFDKNL